MSIVTFLNVYNHSIAFWLIICVTVLGLISDINLLGCGHCKKMKPEYDEAAEILNKGVDVSFITVFCFVLFFLGGGGHGQSRSSGSTSLTARKNQNNPFRCPECCWLMWQTCCFVVSIISGFCFYPFLFATLSSVVTNNTPHLGEADLLATVAWLDSLSWAP